MRTRPTGRSPRPRTNDQCIDFEYLVGAIPTTVQWDEKVSGFVSVLGISKHVTSHYLFTTKLHLDLRFELCNGGLVDATDPNSAPLSLNPYYNPDGLSDCFPAGKGNQCGITVTFKNVTTTHTQTAGTIDFIAHKPGSSKEDLLVSHDFMYLPTNDKCTPDGTPTCANRTILDPSALSGPLDNMNGDIRGGAQAAYTKEHETDPLFTVVLSITNDPKAVLAAPTGPFPLGPGVKSTLLPGVLNVELRQERDAQLQVAGSTGCNGVFSTTVDLVGLNFPKSKTGGTFLVHDETRSVPDVTGTFTTDANGGFDTGPLAMAAQTGDKITAFALLVSGAAGVLDPIQYCIG